jgi:hypothetical protein
MGCTVPDRRNPDRHLREFRGCAVPIKPPERPAGLIIVCDGLIPIRASHDTTAHWRVAIDAMRWGVAIRSFHAWQQASRMVS